MAGRYKIISNIRKYLLEENIYTEKDELILILLENTYSDYLLAYKEVKQNGQTLKQKDYNKNLKVVPNPSFKNMMELRKELFRLIDALYLTPKSRRSNNDAPSGVDSPFVDMMNDLNKNN